jgi:cobalt-zinc-cadmium efflux system membrane fusion protein
MYPSYIYKSIIYLVFAAGLSLVGCQSEEVPSAEESSVPTATTFEGIELSPEQEKMAEIETGKLKKTAMGAIVECTGRVEVPPSSLASVYSPIHGFVKEVHYLPGSYVKKGALLIWLSHPEIIKIQREYFENESQLTALEKDFDRKTELMKSQATSQKAFDEAEAAYKLAAAKIKGLEAELKMIGIHPTTLKEKGEIQSFVGIYAPVSGYIAAQNVNLGKLVSPEDLLYEIIDDSHMHLELNVFASDLPRIKEEQKIIAMVPGTDEKVEASVHLIGKMVDPETKTTMVHGHFEKEPIPFTPGTYLTAKIFTEKDSVFALPTSAILTEGQNKAVFYKKDGHYHKMQIETGNAINEMVEIKNAEKLKSLELVTKGAYYLGGIDEEAGHEH